MDESRGSERLGNYLRRLREGYGYTLRKVEERSSTVGDPIDNSSTRAFKLGSVISATGRSRCAVIANPRFYTTGFKSSFVIVSAMFQFSSST